MIRENGGWDLFQMLEIKKFPCKDSNEARAEEERCRVELQAILNSIKAHSGTENKKDYDKQYHQEHANELREKSKQYRQKHADEIREKQRQYCQEHADEKHEYDKQYRQEHADELREKKRQYYQKQKKITSKP
jgi:hypothetical protein